MDIQELTIKRAHQGLMKKEFSAKQLTQAFLDEIEKKNKEIFAYLSLTPESALSQAEKVDELIEQGREIPFLAGIPCAAKDNILFEGERCTAGSKALEDYIAPYSATVVEKLKKEGAVFLGKTNLDEFAMGSSTENSFFGPTKNPHNLERVPGGSSGGSAAAVSAGLCVYALGSDTGGSIREPASFCGVVGLKPTYGAVSRRGLIAFASSLDQIGPLTKNVEDCQAVFDIIKGRDPLDSTSVELKNNDQPGKPGIKKLHIGIPKEYFVKGIDPEVEKKVKEAIKQYETMGARIIEVSLPHTEHALLAYYIISSAEASANLARYDGIRYGFVASREKGFGSEVRRRIIMGTYTLSAGYYDAYYLRAQKVRTLIKDEFDKVFKKVDVLMSPVSPVLPFKLGEKIADPLSMYLVDVFTDSVNLVGLPALSLPVGDVNGLPVGLQIIGRPFEENKIFEIGKLYEHQH